MGGGVIREWGLDLLHVLERGAYLKFFDRQRQNYTMSMEWSLKCYIALITAMNYCVIQMYNKHYLKLKNRNKIYF